MAVVSENTDKEYFRCGRKFSLTTLLETPTDSSLEGGAAYPLVVVTREDILEENLQKQMLVVLIWICNAV